MKKKFLVIGLGNEKFPKTRHNVGADVLDSIAYQYGKRFVPDKHSHVTTINTVTKDIYLVKPTHMNSSGKAVKYFMQREQINPENIIVITDDIYLPTGQLKYKSGGGSGGHKGIQSIINEINSKDFQRVKIGIGNAFEKGEQKKFVLGSFSREEYPIIQRTIEEARNLIL